MADTAITIKNKFILDNLSVLNRHMGTIIGRVVDPPIKKFMRSYTQQNLKPYPPVPSGSTYQRTKELFRAWDVLANRREAWSKIINTISYARYVIGDDQQWYHDAAGWIFLADEGRIMLPKVVPVASRALESETFRFLTKRGLI